MTDEPNLITAQELTAQIRSSFPWRPDGPILAVLPFTPAESSAGSLIVTPEASRQKPEYGLVFAAGSGGYSPESGTQLRVTHKVGELVMFGRYSGIEPEPVDGWKFYLLQDAVSYMTYQDENPTLLYHPDKKAVHFAGQRCEYCPRLDQPAAQPMMGEIIDAEVDELPSKVQPPAPDTSCPSCPHPQSRHSFSGCLERDPNGPLGYCACKEKHGSVDPTMRG